MTIVASEAFNDVIRAVTAQVRNIASSRSAGVGSLGNLGRLWAVCTCNGVVHVAPGFAIKVFSSLNDHQVSREVHPPSQSAGGNQNLRQEDLLEIQLKPKESLIHVNGGIQQQLNILYIFRHLGRNPTGFRCESRPGL